jgi:2-oxoglutarate dehydrogenase E2 component (dihydrolipoamide succinyltransferase)
MNQNLIRDEEPLILEQVHEEKILKKKKHKFHQQQEKWQMKQKLILSSVKGSGKNGVILKEDIMSLMGLNLPQLKEKLNMALKERVKMTRLKINNCKKIKRSTRKCCNANNF